MKGLCYSAGGTYDIGYGNEPVCKYLTQDKCGILREEGFKIGVACICMNNFLIPDKINIKINKRI